MKLCSNIEINMHTADIVPSENVLISSAPMLKEMHARTSHKIEIMKNILYTEFKNIFIIVPSEIFLLRSGSTCLLAAL